MIPINVDAAPLPLDPLTQYAPALASHLRSLFGAESAAFLRLQALFNFCFLNGGREDPLMPRAVDESYNPKLARLAQLLISECAEKSETVLAAGLLASVDHLVQQQAPAAQEVREMAASAQRENSTLQSRGISLALHLDRVRHLHQSNRDAEQSAAVLLAARACSGQPLAEARYNKLKTMLTHAISQQERRCTK